MFAIVAPARAGEHDEDGYTRARGSIAERGRGRRTGRPVFAASAAAAAAAPVADKKAREFPEILSEGLIAIIIVEWVAVVATGSRDSAGMGIARAGRRMRMVRSGSYPRATRDQPGEGREGWRASGGQSVVFSAS